MNFENVLHFSELNVILLTKQRDPMYVDWGNFFLLLESKHISHDVQKKQPAVMAVITFSFTVDRKQ
jgi:hypothetical protein